MLHRVFSTIFCAFIVWASLVVYAHFSEKDALLFAIVSFLILIKFDMIANDLSEIREHIVRLTSKESK